MIKPTKSTRVRENQTGKYDPDHPYRQHYDKLKIINSLDSIFFHKHFQVSNKYKGSAKMPVTSINKQAPTIKSIYLIIRESLRVRRNRTWTLRFAWALLKRLAPPQPASPVHHRPKISPNKIALNSITRNCRTQTFLPARICIRKQSTRNKKSQCNHFFSLFRATPILKMACIFASTASTEKNSAPLGTHINKMIKAWQKSS